MFSYHLPSAKVTGFLPKGTGFVLKQCLQLSIETCVPCRASVSPASTLLCTSLSFSVMRNGESRGSSVLHGSQAVLMPPWTCLLSRLNSPNISCLFSHRNVSVITLFPCFCTFLDARAAQDVPNLAGCPSCWGKEIAFPCLQLCQSLTPPTRGNNKKKNPHGGKLCQQVRTIRTLEKAPGCLEDGCRGKGDEKNREILGGWS